MIWYLYSISYSTVKGNQSMSGWIPLLSCYLISRDRSSKTRAQKGSGREKKEERRNDPYYALTPISVGKVLKSTRYSSCLSTFPRFRTLPPTFHHSPSPTHLICRRVRKQKTNTFTIMRPPNSLRKRRTNIHNPQLITPGLLILQGDRIRNHDP